MNFRRSSENTLCCFSTIFCGRFAYRRDITYPEHIPANTRSSANVGTMLGQRQRRWANIVPTSAERLVFAVHLSKHVCWASVADWRIGPSFTRVSYSLGILGASQRYFDIDNRGDFRVVSTTLYCPLPHSLGQCADLCALIMSSDPSPMAVYTGSKVGPS